MSKSNYRLHLFSLLPQVLLTYYTLSLRRINLRCPTIPNSCTRFHCHQTPRPSSRLSFCIVSEVRLFFNSHCNNCWILKHIGPKFNIWHIAFRALFLELVLSCPTFFDGWSVLLISSDSHWMDFKHAIWNKTTIIVEHGKIARNGSFDVECRWPCKYGRELRASFGGFHLWCLHCKG